MWPRKMSKVTFWSSLKDPLRCNGKKQWKSTVVEWNFIAAIIRTLVFGCLVCCNRIFSSSFITKKYAWSIFWGDIVVYQDTHIKLGQGALGCAVLPSSLLAACYSALFFPSVAFWATLFFRLLTRYCNPVKRLPGYGILGFFTLNIWGEYLD